MPSRSQAMIRRDINRLKDTTERNADDHSALAAIKQMVSSAAETVNSAWQRYQVTAIAGDKEREERESAVRSLIEWLQRWRPVLLLVVPGAAVNIRTLPPSGATPDDVIRVAEDMIEFVKNNPGAESFRDQALQDLGDNLENARKETSEAAAALPAEAAARQTYSEACQIANNVLVSGTEVVRAIFGRTSPEYKQFIARSSASEEGEIESESNLGEV